LDDAVWDKVQHGYVDSNGVKIHYATMGKGPLLVMIHGFPDFWYSWRAQMAGLAESYQVVAIDQRGYNLSDKPQGQQNYKQNYPKEPYKEDTSPLVKVKAPVLMFHGLKDTALLAPGLNNTWDWLESDLTLVTVPNAGHWVQDDAADLVTSTMKSWLALHPVQR
jgi:pimeloyl-ACP methyl ester carboxylesterase